MEIFFSRLDTQITLVRSQHCKAHQGSAHNQLTRSHLIGPRPLKLKPSYHEPSACLSTIIPVCCTSLEEARDTFDRLWNRCYHQFYTANDYFHASPSSQTFAAIVAGRDEYLKMSRVWLTSFEDFLSKNPLDERGKQGALALQIGQTFGDINFLILEHAHHLCETNFDRYISRYERIVALATKVLESTLSDLGDNAKHPSLYLDMHLVAPLNTVIYKYRGPFIRRKALRLLKSHPRREGVWDSIVASKVDEKVISREEDGLELVMSCHDVPEWSRVKGFMLDSMLKDKYKD